MLAKIARLLFYIYLLSTSLLPGNWCSDSLRNNTTTLLAEKFVFQILPDFKMSLVVFLPFFDSLDLATNVNTLVLMALCYLQQKSRKVFHYKCWVNHWCPLGEFLAWIDLWYLIYDTLEGHLQTHVYYYIRSVSKKCAQDQQIFRRMIFLEKDSRGRHYVHDNILLALNLKWRFVIFVTGNETEHTKSANTQHVLPCGSCWCVLLRSSSALSEWRTLTYALTRVNYIA